MPKSDDGGPAFPHAGCPTGVGLSARDWFAGQALVGAQFEGGLGGKAAIHPEYLSCLARDCYDIADAMLAERRKGVEDA